MGWDGMGWDLDEGVVDGDVHNWSNSTITVTNESLVF